MDKEQLEREFDEILKRTRKLIDDAYVCGYKDGYFECIVHKHKATEEPLVDDSIIQVSI